MSRETYQPPSLSGGPNTSTSNPGASNTGSTPAFNLTGNTSDPFADAKPVTYLCGDCDLEIQLKKGDAIRCKECGYRVLYKQRTGRMVQFEAR